MILRFSLSISTLVALLLACTQPAISAPTIGELAQQCDDAFAAQRWPDVVDACTTAAANIADALQRNSAATDADKLAVYEVLATMQVRIAAAQIELGDLEHARGHNRLALAYLDMATLYGLSKNSEKYQKLKGAIDTQAAGLGP